MNTAEVEALIRQARTGHEMNAIPEKTRDLDELDRARLQLLFDSRCHEMWPQAYRGRR